MQQPVPSTIDTDFAALHGLSRETLRVLVDLAPQLSTKGAFDLAPAHPASAVPCAEGVQQQCFRARYEAAEKRYLRMKGMLHASMEAQQRMGREIAALRVADTIVRLGLGSDCSAVLGCMQRVAVEEGTVLDEMDALTRRLDAVVAQNEALVRINRELRGVAEPAMMEDVPLQSFCSDERVIRLTAEVETLRKHVTAMELECARLQSEPWRLEFEERLRECEDVFDRILGRERQDYNPSPDSKDLGIGLILRRYHPVGTCQDKACVAYAKRLRGGMQLAVTDAYARERAMRVNGFVRQYIEPLETLRAQKEAEIKMLKERVRRFEQSTRMTGEEADQVQLSTVTLLVLEKEAELTRIKSECACAEREFTRRRGVVARLVAEERELDEELRAARHEIQALTEERQLTIKVTNEFRDEYAKLEKLRAEITRFQSGRTAEEFRQQKKDAADLAVEIENLRIERDQTRGGGGGEMVVDEDEDTGAESVQLSNDSGGRKRSKKTVACPDIFPAPDGTAIIKCKCGDFVPIISFTCHVQTKHATASKRPLLCSEGCGIFIVNRPMAELEAHRRSGECARRMAEIRRLMGGDGL